MVNQVFLGMAASFVPPKRDIVALIEDVEAAGVRFVYFSPRNMRRSTVCMERGDSFPCGVTKLTVVSKADCSTPREKSMPATTVLRISRVGNGPEGTVKHWATVWHEQLGWLVHLLTWSRPVPNA